MNWYRWGRKKQVIRDFQRLAAWARNLQLGDGRHFIVGWCYPRQKQAGWWEVADDAELGYRDYKAKTLVLLCSEELRCASPGQLWFSCGQAGRKEGNFVSALASVFTLHVKAEHGTGLWQCWGTWLTTLNEHLFMGAGEEPWSAGHFGLRWVGSFESLAQGTDA